MCTAAVIECSVIVVLSLSGIERAGAGWSLAMLMRNQHALRLRPYFHFFLLLRPNGLSRACPPTS